VSNRGKTQPKRYFRSLPDLSLAERAAIIHACVEAAQPSSKMGGGTQSMYHLLEVQKALRAAQLDESIQAVVSAERDAMDRWASQDPETRGPRPKPATLDCERESFRLYGSTAKWARDAVMACKAWRGTPESVISAAQKLGCDLSVFEGDLEVADLADLGMEAEEVESVS